jgi:hypothetical protein
MGVSYWKKNVWEIHGFMHLCYFYPVCNQAGHTVFIQNLFACRLFGSMVFLSWFLTGNFFMTAPTVA